MTILEFVAGTFSVQLQDGRIIFRPWGALGPCYLLSPPQRKRRAWVQLVFYVLAFSTFWVFPEMAAHPRSLLTFVVAFTLFGYLLFWLFSIGLPKTDKPPPMTREQRVAAIALHSRALGRPLLWVFAIISWLFAVAGAVIAVLLGEWVTGAFVFVFGGASGAMCTWQLWLIRRRSDD
jgi:hypothetical protein